MSWRRRTSALRCSGHTQLRNSETCTRVVACDAACWLLIASCWVLAISCSHERCFVNDAWSNCVINRYCDVADAMAACGRHAEALAVYRQIMELDDVRFSRGPCFPIYHRLPDTPQASPSIHGHVLNHCVFYVCGIISTRQVRCGRRQERATKRLAIGCRSGRVQRKC